MTLLLYSSNIIHSNKNHKYLLKIHHGVLNMFKKHALSCRWEVTLLTWNDHESTYQLICENIPFFIGFDI